MTKVLPNFSSAAETVETAKDFCLRAANICERLANDGSDMRRELFLRHAAGSTTHLAEALSSYCENSMTTDSQEYMQYTPLEPAPGEAELDRLARAGSDAECALKELQAVAERWCAIFEESEEHAVAPSAKGMYAGCRDLFQTWSKGLSSAYVQGRDT